MEIRATSSRLDGIWWKIGLMAGVIALMVSEVFGPGIGTAFNILVGGLPL